MENKDISKRGADLELRKFGLTLGGAFAILAVVFWWQERWLPAIPYVGWLAASLIILGLLVPASLGFVHRAWMSLGLFLGSVVSRILLTIFFYLVMTPIGLIGRLFGKRFLELDFRVATASYWSPRPARPADRASWEKQY